LLAFVAIGRFNYSTLPVPAIANFQDHELVEATPRSVGDRYVPVTDGDRAGAEASSTTVRMVIAVSALARPSTGSGLSEAAALLNGFEGVALDAEAQAAIAAALQACAARARDADAAYTRGGETAADAAQDDPGESLFRSAGPWRGELVPARRIEEFVPFTPDEPHRSLAGAEKPPELLAIEARVRADGPERGSRKRRPKAAPAKSACA
jgi:hypothetical protein